MANIIHAHPDDLVRIARENPNGDAWVEARAVEALWRIDRYCAKRGAELLVYCAELEGTSHRCWQAEIAGLSVPEPADSPMEALVNLAIMLPG